MLSSRTSNSSVELSTCLHSRLRAYRTISRARMQWRHFRMYRHNQPETLRSRINSIGLSKSRWNKNMDFTCKLCPVDNERHLNHRPMPFRRICIIPLKWNHFVIPFLALTSDAQLALVTTGSSTICEKLHPAAKPSSAVEAATAPVPCHQRRKTCFHQRTKGAQFSAATSGCA